MNSKSIELCPHGFKSPRRRLCLYAGASFHFPQSRDEREKKAATWLCGVSGPALSGSRKMHQPGIEPGSHRWQRCILPLDH